MRHVNAIVSFGEGSITIGDVRHTEWNVGWKKLKKSSSEGRSLSEKELQGEIRNLYGEDDYVTPTPGKHRRYSHNPIAGADDRNKSLEEDQGIGG